MSNVPVPIPVAAIVKAPVVCPNCGAMVQQEFCGQCGQRRGHLHHTLRQILSEFLEELVHWDSRILRTLAPLFVKPGFLSAEFWRGRRASYMRPFQLYLVAAFVFFLVAGQGTTHVVYEMPPSAEQVAAALKMERARTDATMKRFGLPPLDAAQSRVPWFLKELEQWAARRTSNQIGAELGSALVDGMPKAMFVLLPLFALLLRIFDMGSGRLFSESFVFALHVHAFFFFILALAWRLPSPAAGIAWVLGAVYLLLGARRAYDWGWVRSGVTTVVVVFIYAWLIGFAVEAVAFARVVGS